MYSQIREILKPYLMKEKLQEMNHPYSTQVNKALNNAISKRAPKDRDYSQTFSLSGKIGLVVACHSIGEEKFVKRYAQNYNIQLTASTNNILSKMSKRRSQHLEYMKLLSKKEGEVWKRS